MPEPVGDTTLEIEQAALEALPVDVIETAKAFCDWAGDLGVKVVVCLSFPVKDMDMTAVTTVMLHQVAADAKTLALMLEQLGNKWQQAAGEREEGLDA